MNRGNRREPIFQNDIDRQRFLDTLGEAYRKTGWLVHAYCLMAIIFIWGRDAPSQTSGGHEMVGLKKARWTEANLERERKGHPVNVRLAAGATNAFHFVITSDKPFTTTNLTAKVNFSRVILEGGKLADVSKDVQIQPAGD
jgi:hypothetical protein